MFHVERRQHRVPCANLLKNNWRSRVSEKDLVKRPKKRGRPPVTRDTKLTRKQELFVKELV